MAVFFHELRKIFNWRVFALLLPIGFLFYTMFIEFNFTHFPNGSQVYDYTIQQEMVELYGNEMNDADRVDFKERHEARLAEANEYIANHPDAQALGVSTYEEVWSAEPENEGVWGLSSQLLDEADGLFWYVQAERSIIDQFDQHVGQYETMTTAQQERIHKAIAEGENQSILPFQVRYNYDRLIGNMAMLVVISLVVVLSPLYFRDTKSNVMAIQYTTRLGRGLFPRKLLASLVAATLMITILMVGFLVAYVFWNDTTLFWDSTMNSFLNGMFYWYDLTFGTYMAVTIVLIYLLGLTATVGIAIVSRFADSYFSLLGTLVPATIFLFVFGIEPLIQEVFKVYRGEYFTPILYTVLVIIAGGIAVFKTKRERKIDVV